MRITPFIKKSALALAICAAALAGTAHAKTLRWAYQGDATSMDPMALNETFTLGFQGNIYETLAGYDGDMKLTPLLAESWENTEPPSGSSNCARASSSMTARRSRPTT